MGRAPGGFGLKGEGERGIGGWLVGAGMAVMIVGRLIVELVGVFETIESLRIEGGGVEGGSVLRGSVEGFEEVELRGGYGAGGNGGDLGCSFGLADGGLGLGGEEGAVALGVGVALGDGCGDARGASAGRRVDGRGRRRGGGGLWAAGAMGGEALGYLLAEGCVLAGRGGVELGVKLIRELFEEMLACIKLCRAHCAENLNPAA